MNKNGAFFLQTICMLLMFLMIILGDFFLIGFFAAFSLSFGFWGLFLLFLPESKKSPGIWESFNKWYHGSSLEKYFKVTKYGKGDLTGIYYMGFVAFCGFLILNVGPIMLFWGVLSQFNPLIMQYHMQIISMSMTLSIPQFIYLWQTACDYYFKKTGKLKSN